MRKFLFSLLLIISGISIYIHAQNQAGYVFSSLKVGGAGFVTAVVTSPDQQNLIFARTDVGGAYKWIEADKSWKSITDWVPETSVGYMGVESIAIDPQEPDKIYMYCGTSYWNNGKSAIIYSSDAGETWVEKAIVTNLFPAHGNDYGRQSGERLAVDPNKGSVLFCGSRTRGLWKSVNSGASWARLDNSTFPDNVKVAFVQFVKASGNTGAATPTLFVGLQRKGSDNLFCSNDSGSTWKAVKGQPVTYMAHRSLLSNGKLYITYADSEGPMTSGAGAAYKYNLADSVWTNISPSSFSFGDISVDPTNPNNLMCTSMGMWWQQSWIAGGTTYGDQIYLSENDGSSWRNLFPSSTSYSEPDIVWLKTSSQLHWAGSAKIDPFNRNRAFITSGNGIYMTENLWSVKPTWRMALKGLEETVPMELVSVIGGPVVTAIGDYDGFVYHDVTKYYARHNPNMGTTTGIAVAGKNPLKIVRTGSDETHQSIYITSNGGTSWTGITKPLTGAYQGWCAISADGGIIVWTPKDATTYYTTNNGTSWTAMPGITITNIRFSADYETANVFYAIISGQLRTYTYNTGTGIFGYTSVNFTGPVINRLAVVPGISGEIWIPRGSSGLMRVTNANTSPSITTLPLYSIMSVGLGKAAPGKTYPSLYVWGNPLTTSPTGLYRSDDEGQTWVRINDPQHQFGGPGNAQFVKGDMNVYGRVFMSTVGRGIITGELSTPTEIPSFEENQNFSVSGTVFQNSLSVASKSPAIYQIYNLSGILLEEGKIHGSAIVAKSIPKGLYILVLMSTDGRISKKIRKI